MLPQRHFDVLSRGPHSLGSDSQDVLPQSGALTVVLPWI